MLNTLLNKRRNAKKPPHGLNSLLVCLALWLSIPWAAQAESTSPQQVQSVIAKAQQSFEHAQELGHAWSVTPTYIHTAETELAAGKMDQAMAAAQRALLTANKAVEQANAESTAWQARVPTLPQ